MADDPATAPQPTAGLSPKRHGFLRRHPWMTAFVVLPLIGAIAAGAYGFWSFNILKGPREAATVVIPKGSGVRGTATLLERAGIIADDTIFMAGTKLHGAERDLKAGEYLIPAGATMRDVMALLRSGKTVICRFTVAEGLSVRQVVALLQAEPALAGEIGEMPPEGSLMPETYHFAYGDRRAALIQRMQSSMQTTLSRLWEARTNNLPISTPEEALILASIVEKETSVPAERPRVASVFVNRLRIGMPLQSDPTIVYGIRGGERLGRPILQSDLASDTPYNTYKVMGLPPTPIANPGIDSLRAVLNPAQTEDFYFVADGSGGHAFARTYEEHLRNVQRWRAIERQGGAR